jgi:hypothetical protein
VNLSPRKGKRLPMASLFVNSYQLQLTTVASNKRLNYWKYLTSLYGSFRMASADIYAEDGPKMFKFGQFLHKMGFRTHFSQYPTHRLREDLEATIENVEAVILGVTDPSIKELLQHAEKVGTKVYFYMATTHEDLRPYGEFLPLPEDCYYDYKPKNGTQHTPSGSDEQQVVHGSSGGKADEQPF